MDMVLLNSINAYFSKKESLESDYGNTAAILQSSGTGKSRMVHQMRERVFVVPFNIRNVSDRTFTIAPHVSLT